MERKSLALIGRLRIGDPLRVHIVIVVGPHGRMDLPHVLEAGNLGNRIPRRVLPALGRAVVDDDHLRLQRQHVGGRTREIVHKAVVRGLIQRDRAELIHRAREFHFNVAREVAQVEKLELAIGKQESHAALVLGGVAFGSLGVLAQRIRAAFIDRGADRLPI